MEIDKRLKNRIYCNYLVVNTDNTILEIVTFCIFFLLNFLCII